MLVLFESAAGYGLFKVLSEGKLKDVGDIYTHFSSVESANNVYVSCIQQTQRHLVRQSRLLVCGLTLPTPTPHPGSVKLHDFSAFDSTADGLVAATALTEGKLGKDLKKFLKKSIVDKGLKDELHVADTKLGGLIKEKLEIPCVHSDVSDELQRGIRTQLEGLITGLQQDVLKNMSLGLAHSLSRYKLKFSPDKVDTMIVQAIGECNYA
jgi:nucleolar protein 58